MSKFSKCKGECPNEVCNLQTQIQLIFGNVDPLLISIMYVAGYGVLSTFYTAIDVDVIFNVVN